MEDKGFFVKLVAFGFLAILFAGFIGTASVWAEERLLDTYDFDGKDPLHGWELNKAGGKIEVVSIEGQGSCVKISRPDRLNFTYMSKEYQFGSSLKPNSMRFEAEIKAEDIQQGQQKYHQGIFQAVLMSGGKELAHPKVKFDGTFEFTRMEFEAQDLDKAQSVILRIGLQNAKGTMWIDNIKVFTEK